MLEAINKILWLPTGSGANRGVGSGTLVFRRVEGQG
jgi:hypothetical protein